MEDFCSGVEAESEAGSGLDTGQVSRQLVGSRGRERSGRRWSNEGSVVRGLVRGVTGGGALRGDVEDRAARGVTGGGVGEGFG